MASSPPAASLLKVYGEKEFAGMPAFDKNVIDSTRDILASVLVDLKGEKGSDQSKVTAMAGKMRGEPTIPGLFSDFLEIAAEGQNWLKHVIPGSYLMAIKCMFQTSFQYSPAEYVIMSLYTTTYRMRGDMADLYKTFEKRIPKLTNKYIRDIMLSLVKIRLEHPLLLESRFFDDTPFDVNIIVLQCYIDDTSGCSSNASQPAQTARFGQPTSAAGRCSSTTPARRNINCPPASQRDVKGDQMEKFMQAMAPLVETAQDMAKRC